MNIYGSHGNHKPKPYKKWIQSKSYRKPTNPKGGGQEQKKGIENNEKKQKSTNKMAKAHIYQQLL